MYQTRNTTTKSRTRWSQPYNLAPHLVHIQIDCVDSIMAEDGIDPATEKEAALETSRDLFATLFLLNSDKRHFVPLIRDIVNEFKCDRDTYPRTLTSACGDDIVNYRGDQANKNGTDDDLDATQWSSTQRVEILSGAKTVDKVKMVAGQGTSCGGSLSGHGGGQIRSGVESEQNNCGSRHESQDVDHTQFQLETVMTVRKFSGSHVS